jgi:hypothetical protein
MLTSTRVPVLIEVTIGCCLAAADWLREQDEKQIKQLCMTNQDVEQQPLLPQINDGQINNNEGSNNGSIIKKFSYNNWINWINCINWTIYCIIKQSIKWIIKDLD